MQNVHLYITVFVVITRTRLELSKVFVHYDCSGHNLIKKTTLFFQRSPNLSNVGIGKNLGL